MFLIDLAPDLGVAAQVARTAVASVEIVDDVVGKPDPSHIELTLVDGKVYKSKSAPFVQTQMTYGRLTARINSLPAMTQGGNPCLTTVPTSGPAAMPPRTPQLEMEAKQAEMIAVLLVTLFAHGPNTQAIVARAQAWLDDPVNWNLVLTVLLGPPAPAP
jgi:hypothetical protein